MLTDTGLIITATAAAVSVLVAIVLAVAELLHASGPRPVDPARPWACRSRHRASMLGPGGPA